MSCTLLGGDVCSISACSFLLCKHQMAVHKDVREEVTLEGTIVNLMVMTQKLTLC